MRVYFDTNLYRYISSLQEEEVVRDFLRLNGLSLFCSLENLLETVAIENDTLRNHELTTLTSLAIPELQPEALSHSKEMRTAIGKYRPLWLRNPRYNEIEKYRKTVNGYKTLWDDCSQAYPRDRTVYKSHKEQVMEVAIARQREVHTALRDHFSDDRVWTLKIPGGQQVEIDMNDPEEYWRINNLQVWFDAVVMRIRSSKDYLDWLGPFIVDGCFRDGTYHEFWLNEVTPEDVPLNRIVALTSFYQLRGKAAHGNAMDQLHAGHWLDSDLFLTADKEFCKILGTVAERHYDGRHGPQLINRGLPSFVDQLERIVR